MSFLPKDWIIIIIQVGIFLKVTMTFAGVHMIYQILVSQMVWGTVKPPSVLKRAILMIITYVLVLVAANLLTDLLPVLGIGGAMGLIGMYVMAPLAELKDDGWKWRGQQSLVPSSPSSRQSTSSRTRNKVASLKLGSESSVIQIPYVGERKK
jgi:hypothetical protein